MIVWGGNSDAGLLDTGGRYNPNTDTWTATSTTNVPTARDYHTAVWTGSQMIVWGGEDDSFNRLNRVGDTILSRIAGQPQAPLTHHLPENFTRRSGAATEMIVWGGQDDNFRFPRDRGKYNPYPTVG